VSYRYPDARIIVFCKTPLLGKVKSRLMPELTAEQAMAVHIQLTERLLSWLSKSQLCQVDVWAFPDQDAPFFKQCEAEFDISLSVQCEGDLGQKMSHAIAHTLSTAKHVILIGTDCPSLSAEHIESSLKALEAGQDIVIAPAEDGGYTMIGCSQSYPVLFEDIAWSTDTVFTVTKQKIDGLGLRCYVSPLQWDVDTFIDWQRFCALPENSRK